MKLTIVVFLGVLAAGWFSKAWSANDDVEASAENKVRATAAKAFADAMSSVGSVQHAKAFKGALDLASRLEDTPRIGGPRVLAVQGLRRGDVDVDARYRKNLEAMMATPGGKIWKGQDVPAGAYPEVVAITGNNGLCTGTLIAPAIVLTAAHCYYAGVRLTVVVGDNLLKPAQPPITVQRSVAMIPANSSLMSGDLALLFLEKDAGAAAAALAEAAEINASTEVIGVGFGRTEDDTGRPIGIKRSVDLPVASSNCAGTVSTDVGGVADSDYYGCGTGTELVAGLPRLDRDTCNGDSGGPLFIKTSTGKRVLVAVTSRAVAISGAVGCGDGGVYTRVDGAAREWIRRNTGIAAADRNATNMVPVREQSTLTARSEPIGTPAQPVADATTRKAEEAVNKYLSTIPVGERTQVSGSLSIKGDGKSIFLRVRTPSDLLIPIVNPESLPRPLQELPGTFTIAREGDGVRVVTMTILAIEQLKQQSSALPDAAREKVQQYVNGVRSTGQNPDEDNGAFIANLANVSQQQLILAYKALKPSEAAKREAIAKAFKAVTDTSKAYYDSADRSYKPVIYERMFKNAEGVLAIRVRDTGEVFCSGALLGDSLVLTAAHCLEHGNPSEFEVVVNYESDFDDKAAQPLLVFPVKADFISASKTSLDFVVLRLGANPAGQLPRQTVAVTQCIDPGRVRQNDPIYVIGHPRGQTKVVADPGYVNFPYQLSEQELDRLLLQLEAQYLGDAQRDNVIKQVKDSYQRFTDANGTWFLNYSVKWQGKPTIGAIVDTFQGNSGSPAYRRNRNYVIGILVAGEPDANVAYQPGWLRHEAILPIAEIVKDLELNHPGWRSDQHVCDATQVVQR